MLTNAGKQKVLFQKICINLPIRVFGLDLHPPTLAILQAPVVQRMDNAIHQINRHPVDEC